MATGAVENMGGYILMSNRNDQVPQWTISPPYNHAGQIIQYVGIRPQSISSGYAMQMNEWFKAASQQYIMPVVEFEYEAVDMDLP